MGEEGFCHVGEAGARNMARVLVRVRFVFVRSHFGSSHFGSRHVGSNQIIEMSRCTVPFGERQNGYVVGGGRLEGC